MLPGGRVNLDYLARATALDGRVRAFALTATGVVAEIQSRHGMNPVPTAAVGRTAMGALLLSAASLKERDQILTVEVKGDGPLGRIICTANGAGEVRALASNPFVHAPSTAPGKLNVAGVVGSRGYISVTKDLGLRETYTGTVELRSGEIGEDIAYYLGRSEQTPSAVGLGVFVLPDGSVEAAGGFLVQLLPGLDDAEIASIEREISSLPHPTTLIRQGVTPEGVLDMIFPGGVELLDSYEVRFRCPCSRERFEAALITLGAEELARIIEEEEQEFTELVCHFCNESYRFTPAEMESLLRAAT
jgi:molecular chaperone Hsp33